MERRKEREMLTHTRSNHERPLARKGLYLVQVFVKFVFIAKLDVAAFMKESVIRIANVPSLYI